MTTLIKHSNRNYFIDTTTKQITLADNRFYHDEASNSFVPSVTTILSAFPKGAAFYEWMKKAGENADEIRDEAGRRGSVVHGLTERFDLGEEVSLLDDYGDFKVKLLEWSMFERYVEFRGRFPMEIEFIEQNFVSTELGFAGTTDRIVIIDGKRYLLDIKTSNYIGDEYWLQLAAYKKLAETLLGIQIDGVGVLWLNAKTRTQGKSGDMQGPGYQLITRMDSTDDYELFLNTKRLWEKLNGTMKPKQISYSLSHQLLDTMPAQLVCKKCGVADDIVIGEGKGPHFAAITCGSCGGYIKWATEKEVNSLTFKNK